MKLRHSSLCIALFALSLIAACGGSRSGPLVVQDSNQTQSDYEYLIPVGTGDRIRAGEDVEILPAELDVRVGETIRIVNQDDEGHFVGVFYVGPGETVTERFSSPGEYTGQCTIHPSGKLSLKIHA